MVNGLDAAGFTAGGLRGGRQKGAQAKAEDFALVGPAGLAAGARACWSAARPISATRGRGCAGRSGTEVDVGTTLLEAHVEWRWQGLEVRGLLARAELDEVGALNAALGLTGSCVGGGGDGGVVCAGGV